MSSSSIQCQCTSCVHHVQGGCGLKEVRISPSGRCALCALSALTPELLASLKSQFNGKLPK